MDEATLAFGAAATRALLGVDALYRAESGDGEGLAVLNMDREGAFPAEPLASYEAARARFSALREEAAGLTEPDRRRYYDRFCHSTLAFIRWRMAGLPFETQLTDFLHVPARPASAADLDTLRDGMHALLGAMGHEGDLASRCRAWEERNRVAPDVVARTLEELLDEAWTRTEERLIPIPAPRSDGMLVRTVSGVPYNARCDYLARTIEVNTDPVLTRPALKHLAVHEGCPGHYVQFKLRETWARDGTAAPDVLLSVVNTASSSVFEGIADAGSAMIDWVESDDDRLQALLNRYRAGLGTQAAWRLHALGMPAPEVADWLRSRALVGGDGWVDNRMRFIAAPSRAVLIWSYWWGEASVAPAWARVADDARPGFIRFLYGRMHAPDTVGMFAGLAGG
jgi:hypothetical protein